MSRKQALFCRSKKWLRGLCTGRGFGKTRIGCMDLLMRARNGQSLLVVSPSYVVLSQTTWPMMRRVAQEMGVWISGVRSPLPTIKVRTCDHGEAEIVFRSGEDPESLRGANISGLWLDEASLVSEDVYLLSIACLRDEGAMGNVSMTYTPKGRTSWTFKVFFTEAEESEVREATGAYTGEISEEFAGAVGYRLFCGRWYKEKPDTELIQAGSWENPFLPPEYVARIRSQYTTAFAEQELAGNIVDLTGNIFARDWFLYADQAPRRAQRLRYWDLAGSQLSGCYTAGVLLAMDDDLHLYVEDVVRFQLTPFKRNEQILETAHKDRSKYGYGVATYFEREGGSGGLAQNQQLQKILLGFDTHDHQLTRGGMRTLSGEKIPGEAKIKRAMPFAAWCEAKNVTLIRGKWNDAFVEELVAFAESKYMDQVDAASEGYTVLSNLMIVGGFKAPQDIQVESSGHRFGVGANTEGGARRR